MFSSHKIAQKHFSPRDRDQTSQDFSEGLTVEGDEEEEAEERQERRRIHGGVERTGERRQIRRRLSVTPSYRSANSADDAKARATRGILSGLRSPESPTRSRVTQAEGRRLRRRSSRRRSRRPRDPGRLGGSPCQCAFRSTSDRKRLFGDKTRMTCLGRRLFSERSSEIFITSSV
uniref:Uncharacterized protein n=1 Tax=Steinernema glaseri TaxID=37863 RepID=A0A1I7ZVF5_9BILA